MSDIAQVAGEATTIDSTPLTNADRCDRCSAGAKVRATLDGGGTLLFCQHHFNDHEARLVELGAVISS